MTNPLVSPAPWRTEEITLTGAEDPVCIRILDGNGRKVCDVHPDPSVGGQGIDVARANAAFICKQRLAL